LETRRGKGGGKREKAGGGNGRLEEKEKKRASPAKRDREKAFFYNKRPHCRWRAPSAKLHIAPWPKNYRGDKKGKEKNCRARNLALTRLGKKFRVRAKARAWSRRKGF
jgi:hypothetical protein